MAAMDDTNGSVGPAKPGTAMNGASKPAALNGSASIPRRRTIPRRPGILARSFNTIARLLTWYSIFTILFRCPPTLDDCNETTPRVCKPYFQLKQTVSPHIEPYYETYAAPYVEVVRPYYDTLDRTVIAPSWQYANKYGAPRIQQVQSYGKAQWDKLVQPELTKYQKLVGDRYNETVAPHVDRVSTAVGPYYDIARTNALQTYHELLLPSYFYVQPYLLQGYQATSAFTVTTVVPSVVWAWNKTYVFLDGTVWPQVRIMYVENVEPQLVKIGKRLGRYNNGSKKSVPKPVAEASSATTQVKSSFTRPSASAATSVAAASQSSSTTSTTPAARASGDAVSKASAFRNPTRSSIEPIPPPEVDEKLESEDPVRRSARETVAEDLQSWQEKFTKATDEGAAEIDERVQEIAKRMIRRNARIVGKARLDALQSSAVTELVGLRRKIIELVGSVNKGSATIEQGQERLVQLVREAGIAVRDKAKGVRTWRESYEAEMRASITKAAESHFTILENIRDLALQKIGMKWAWLDGVTYKDWAKYHQLKGRFDEWKGTLEDLIVNHPSLEAAQLEGADIEEQAMKVAAATAKELGRLKQVAYWKLVAGDDTSEFDSTLMQKAAEAAESARMAAGNAINNAQQAVADTVNEAVDGAAKVVSNAQNAAADAQAVIVDKASEAADAVSGAVVGSSEAASEATSAATVPTEPEKQPASEASSDLSEVVGPTSEPTLESEAAGHVANEAAPEMASAVLLETPLFAGNTTELGEDRPAPAELPVEIPESEESETADADDLASARPPVADPASTVKPALFGAAAQSVPSRQPVLEDEDEDSGALEAMLQDIKSAYSTLLSQANGQFDHALSAVSVQIHGTPKPAHEKLLASVTSAYSEAMASASSRLNDALQAASEQVYGTPTTTKQLLPTAISIPGVDWERVESLAVERLYREYDNAQRLYQKARLLVVRPTPTPSTPAEHVNKLLADARRNWLAGVSGANARYSTFMSAASSALSSLTATPTPTDLAGTASSVASVASKSAASAASVASESAASVASVAGESAASAVSAVSEAAASAASAAGENVSAAAAAGYDNAAAIASKVSQEWEVIVAKISEQVYGPEPPEPGYVDILTDNVAAVTDAAGGYASVASDQISKHYEEVSSLVSELLAGRAEPSVEESALGRLRAAYATGFATASSVVASVASEATEAVKGAVHHEKDEL